MPAFKCIRWCFWLSSVSILFSRVLSDATNGCAGHITSFEAIKDIDFSLLTMEFYTSKNQLVSISRASKEGFYYIPIPLEAEGKLQVHAPANWVFKETSVFVSGNSSSPDACAGATNFVFLGFSISGQIKKWNTPSTPFTLTLASTRLSLATRIQETTVDADGQFAFQAVLPGVYVVEAKSPVACVTPELQVVTLTPTMQTVPQAFQVGSSCSNQ